MELFKTKCIRNFDGSAYLTRINVLEIGRLSIKIHVFNSSDDFRTTSFHTHPFFFAGLILSKPGYLEHNNLGTFHRKQWYMQFRKPEYAHRVELFKYEKDDPDAQGSVERPVATLFITWRPAKPVSWHFQCPNGNKDYEQFNKDQGC